MNNEIKVNAFEAYKKTKMQAGKEYIYEFLNIKEDKDNKGHLIMPWYYLSPSDVVSHEGEFHEIAIVQRYNQDGTYALHQDVAFTPANMGRVSLTPGEPLHEEIFRFMEWSNKNESNPNRRTTVEPVFKRINVSAVAKADNDKQKALFDAKQLFYSAKESDLKSLAIIYGIPTEDMEVAKQSLMLKLEGDTDKFLKLINKSPETKGSLVLIKTALKEGILKDNKELMTITFGDSDKPIHQYFTRNVKEQELLDEIMLKHRDVYDAINAQIG